MEVIGEVIVGIGGEFGGRLKFSEERSGGGGIHDCGRGRQRSGGDGGGDFGSGVEWREILRERENVPLFALQIICMENGNSNIEAS